MSNQTPVVIRRFKLVPDAVLRSGQYLRTTGNKFEVVDASGQVVSSGEVVELTDGVFIHDPINEPLIVNAAEHTTSDPTEV